VACEFEAAARAANAMATGHRDNCVLMADFESITYHEPTRTTRLTGHPNDVLIVSHGSPFLPCFCIGYSTIKSPADPTVDWAFPR